MAFTELRHEVLTAGREGAALQAGQRATVHALGAVAANGGTNKFWSTRDPGQKPFTWQAGLGQVIEGWDKGVLGMKMGEVRRIFIPAKQGYGASGFPAWNIPPNADLQFDIELLSVQ
eukprot:GHVT01059768.1.p1 GENE.GHVT01059768.1~~GHVT01059768.1.p1  ORF type:complete len:117 (+),score=30.29 GHVT01059768.1:273-623(+)